MLLAEPPPKAPTLSLKAGHPMEADELLRDALRDNRKRGREVLRRKRGKREGVTQR